MARTIPSVAASEWPRSCGSRSTSIGVVGALCGAQRDSLGALLAGDDDHPLDRLRARRGREHVGEHRA